MEKNDIHALFERVAEQSVQDDESVKRVFSILIKTTLKYRDDIKEARNITVTVEHVRTALDWLVSSLNTGRLPNTENKISLDLLKLWLDEFRY